MSSFGSDEVVQLGVRERSCRSPLRVKTSNRGLMTKARQEPYARTPLMRTK